MALTSSFPGAFSGFVSSLPGTIAFGTIVYAPMGDEWLANGILACLVGHVLAGALSATLSSSKELIIGPRSFAAVILSAIVSAIFLELSAVIGNEAAAVVSIVCCMLVGILSGIIQIFLGLFNLEKLVQFIPFQVVSSIVNVTAILIFSHQIPRILGINFSPWSIDFYFNLNLVKFDSFFLAIISIALMLLLPKKIKGIPNALITLFLVIILAFTLRYLFDGFMFQTLPSISVSDYFTGKHFALQNILLVLTQPHLLLLMLLAAISLACLNTLTLLIAGKSVSILLNQSADQNRDLIGNGISNIVTSAFGAIPGSAKLGATTIALNQSARGANLSRLVAFLYSLLIVGALPYLALVPVPVLAGISAVLSVRLLDDKIRGIITRLMRIQIGSIKSDLMYLTILIAVLASAIIFNFLFAVVVGIAIAVLEFLIHISKFKIEAIPGEQRRSRTHRIIQEENELESGMSNLIILDVSGFILFPVTERLKLQIDQNIKSSCKYIIFDLNDVHYIDETGRVFLSAIFHQLSSKGIELFLTKENIDTPILTMQTDWRELLESFPNIKRFNFLDDALLEIEERILEHSCIIREPRVPINKSDVFAGLTIDEFKLAFEYFSKHTAEAESLLHQGEGNPALFIIVEGKVDIIVETPEGNAMRLFTFTNGAIVGEVSFLDETERSANVVCKTETVYLELTKKSYLNLQEKEPLIASKVVQNIAKILANRLRRTNQILQKAN